MSEEEMTAKDEALGATVELLKELVKELKLISDDVGRIKESVDWLYECVCHG